MQAIRDPGESESRSKQEKLQSITRRSPITCLRRQAISIKESICRRGTRQNAKRAECSLSAQDSGMRVHFVLGLGF